MRNLKSYKSNRISGAYKKMTKLFFNILCKSSMPLF